jgi:sugar phosphate isomerase/epimerase
MNRISLQLYSVREMAAVDFASAVRKIAALGFQGVETAGFPGTTPQAAGALFKELGLEVVASHSGLPEGDAGAAQIDAVAACGSPLYIVPWVKPEHIATVDLTKQFCDRLNAAARACKARGLGFGYHNHWMEMADLGGTYVYQVMNQHLDPAILWEVDTYWSLVAGLDPARVVTELGSRAQLLHLKDGPGNREQPMVALGTGVMDFPSLLKAAKYMQAPIIEFDRCAGDILADLKASVEYLKKF